MSRSPFPNDVLIEVAAQAADMTVPENSFDPIVAQYAEQSSFLWLLRSTAVEAPNITLRELKKLDERIAAHLDGLLIAGEARWNPCLAEMSASEPGALFSETVLALEAKDVPRLDKLVSMAATTPPLRAGLVSAFGWTSARFLQDTARDLLTAGSSFRRGVGIECCAMHSVDPGRVLQESVTDEDSNLRSHALSAAGRLGRVELCSFCDANLSHPSPACRVAAVSSAVLLGNRGTALEALARLGFDVGETRARAFRLMLQAMNIGTAHGILQDLRRDPRQLHWLIQGSGIVGDPAYVTWLIAQMANEQTARMSAEAFSLITGVDLARNSLEGKQPEGFESGPNDDPDDPNVDMDPDDGLPWPDVKKIEKWWASNASRFQKGTRYFMGAPVTRAHCIDVLKNGYQRQRILAAHYLCLLEPGTPLFNTSAPAWRQQRLLAKMT